MPIPPCDVTACVTTAAAADFNDLKKWVGCVCCGHRHDGTNGRVHESGDFKLKETCGCFTFNFATSNIAANRTVTLPALSANDTFAFLGVANVYTADQVLCAASVRWAAGVAVVACEYSIQRNADGTNQLHLNVPTGAGFEFSINDVAQWTITSAGALNNSVNGALNVNAGNVVFDERADPCAPAANSAILYAKDNGSCKTQLVVRFATGAVQVIATEP